MSLFSIISNNTSRRSRAFSENKSSECFQSLLKTESNSNFTCETAKVYEIIIDEAIDLIQIVNKKNYDRVRLTKWKYKSLRDRFGQREKNFTFEEEHPGVNENMRKFHSDSARLCTALHIIKDELYQIGTFEKLSCMVADFQNTKQEELNILNNSREKDKYEDLKHKVEFFNQRINKMKHDKFYLIDGLETDYIETTLVNEIDKIYTEKWEDFANEEYKFSENMKHQDIINQNMDTYRKIENETYVHSRIVEYLWSNINELNEDTDMWTKKYADAYHEKTNDIIRIKEKRETLKIAMMQLEKQYLSRNEEMEEYLMWRDKKKEEEELEKQQEELLEESSETKLKKKFKKKKSKATSIRRTA